MSQDIPPRVRRSSSVLVFTFILGIAIGFSLAYATFDSLHWNFAEKKGPAAIVNTTEPSAPPVEPTPSSSANPEPPGEGEASIPPPETAAAPDAQAIAAVADVKGLWPARHVFITLAGTELDDAAKALLAGFKPGGVVLQPENLGDEAQTQKLVKQIKEAVGLGTGLSSPPFIAVAQEGGANGNPLKVEPAPSAADLGQKGNADEVKQCARAYAEAARKRGINVLLAPVLDPFVTGVSPEDFKPRAFADKPKLVTSLGLAFMEGVLEGGITPVAKFYPGLSAATPVDGTLTIQKTEVRELAELLYSFSEAAAHKVPCILAAPVAVPGLDREDPKRLTPFSPKMIQQLLRGQWAYEGAVLADDLLSPNVPKDKPVEELAVACLSAGCDAMILSNATSAQLTAICQAIAAACAPEGALGPERLSVSKARLDAWQKRIGEHEQTPKETPAQAISPIISQPPNTKMIKHRIQKGETLKGIAKKYSVRTSDLMTWNNLTGPDIRFDTDLLVFVPETPAAPAPEPAKTLEESEGSHPEMELIEGSPEPLKTPAPTLESEKAPETPPPASAPTPEPEKAPETPPPTPAPTPEPEKAPETPPPAPAPTPEPEKAPETPPAPETPKPVDTAQPVETPPSVAEPTMPPPTPSEESPAPESEETVSETSPASPAEATPVPTEQKSEEQEYEFYTVTKGDNLRRIAERFHITEDELAKINQITDHNLIKDGQKLKVPKQ
ncbi:MAG TPA: glycoside hydrolase family 3 N-terminal domain-containing protein [Candidatus Hydrogenedentes bacterium]|nr:glycoside hydrolase family 3 N-terminal domain-containing protein [Candidatus Hydrogenedentota bacterium]